MIKTNRSSRYLLWAFLFVMVPGASFAESLSSADSFYSYDGSEPLSSMEKGAVLKKRSFKYTLLGFPTVLDVTQILYRTQNARGEPAANVTSVISGPIRNGKVISYQSAYDSLNPFDSPSAVIANNRDVSKVFNLGPLIFSAESIPLSALVKSGYTVVVPDIEGQTADFAAGPEYGFTTLDSIRAVINEPETGIGGDARFALIGYSGGGIGAAWAAALAPVYSPEINDNLVGAAYGGLLVSPVNNLDYVNNSIVWGGVVPATLVGLARAYDLDIKPYLSEFGLSVYEDIKDQSLAYVLPKYAGLNFDDLLLPYYLEKYNEFRRTGVIPKELKILEVVNEVNLGLIGSPTIPVYFTQGSVGATQGTFSSRPGDGVMLAGDARSLVHKYCKSGVRVEYNEVLADHVGAGAAWVAGMLPWIEKRFAGYRAPSNCWVTRYLRGSSIDRVDVAP